jgi:hypothetical protein
MRQLGRRGAALLSTVVLTTAGLAFAAGTSAGAASVEKSFEDDGEHEWVVPEDICSVWVEAWGAAGGDSIDENEGLTTATPGGDGGRASAHIAVTPGETLWVNVGERGGDAHVSLPGEGGFNGGGDGGGASSDEGAAGGGGGGASDVRQGGDDLEDRVVVAGGGGGAGGGAEPTLPPGGDGGDGGGEEGDDGEPGGGNPPVDPDQPGEGGGEDEGGDGGIGTEAQLDGDDGERGEGGDGGGVATDVSEFEGGGGGGGGWYGGGGGAGASDQGGDTSIENGAGGGGGSGRVPEGGELEAGENEDDDGEVTISYDPVRDACGVEVEAEAIEIEPKFTG